MNWMPPYRNLDQIQRNIISEIDTYRNSTYWVEGFAGSGKTIVLVNYMLQYLKQYPGRRVCFLTYTLALCDLVKSGLTDVEQSSINIQTYVEFEKHPRFYDLIVIDEVQDIPQSSLVKIKAYTKWLVIAGDTDQRIYDIGVNEQEIFNATNVQRRRKLVKVFRITKKIADIAKTIFPPSRIDLADHGNRGLNKGSDPFLWHFKDEASEVKRVWEVACDRTRSGEPAAILFPRHNDIRKFAVTLAKVLNLPNNPPKRMKYLQDKAYQDFNLYWEGHNINLQYLGNGNGSFELSDHRPMVYLLTYHSSKGLDFPTVFLPFLNNKLEIAWDSLRQVLPDADERVFYVASTRSRGDLYFSYTGYPHYLLERVIAEGHLVETDPNESEIEDEDDDEDSAY